jgi:hypothetical protein
MQSLRSFIKDTHIRMSSEYADANPNMQNETEMNHYKVVLKSKGKQLTTFFSMGLGLTREPETENVLDCLASDASGYENAQSFEDWCSEYGYDTDSRKAEKTFNIIAKQAKQLERFLGSRETYEKLLWNTERL